MRGIREQDQNHCWLMLDDMAVAGDYHFPCIIYLRKMGNPIRKVGPYMREERAEFIKNYKPWEDSICKEMCLDVCIDYNKTASQNQRNKL